MKKILYTAIFFLSIICLNAFMQISNKVVLHELNPRNNNENTIIYSYSGVNREEFINILLEEAGNYNVILYSLYAPENTPEFHYLYVSDSLIDDYINYIPSSFSDIDYSKSYKIGDDKNNSMLFPEYFFISSTTKIKSFDYIYKDDLDFFVNFSISGDSEDIYSLVQKINGYYENPVLRQAKVGSGGENFNSYLNNSFIYDYVLLIAANISLVLLVMLIIINHDKKEISIMKLLGKNNYYITYKKVGFMLIKIGLFMAFIFMIFDFIFIKNINRLAMYLVFYEMIFIMFMIIAFIGVFIIGLLYISYLPMLDTIRNSKSFKFSYYFYSFFKAIVLLMLIPFVVISINYAVNAFKPYTTLKSNYDALASISSFKSFTAEGSINKQIVIEEEFSKIYNSGYFNNLYAVSTGYNILENEEVYIFDMDIKTAKYHGLECQSECSYISNEKYAQFAGQSLDNPIILDGSFISVSPLMLASTHYDNYVINIKPTQEFYLGSYFVVENGIGETTSFKQIVDLMPKEVEDLFTYNSIKNKADYLLKYIQADFLSSFVNTTLVILFIMITNFSILNIYYHYKRKELSVKYITGMKRFKLVSELMFEQLFLDLLVCILCFNRVNSYIGFVFIFLVIILIEVISINHYIGYMIKRNIKEEFR